MRRPKLLADANLEGTEPRGEMISKVLAALAAADPEGFGKLDRMGQIREAKARLDAALAELNAATTTDAPVPPSQLASRTSAMFTSRLDRSDRVRVTDAVADLRKVAGRNRTEKMMNVLAREDATFSSLSLERRVGLARLALSRRRIIETDTTTNLAGPGKPNWPAPPVGPGWPAPDLTLADLAGHPGRNDIERAIELIKELQPSFGKFPYSDQVSRAADLVRDLRAKAARRQPPGAQQ